jgi:arginine deiminase
MGTPFTQVYNRFLGKITDDMYMELTPEDTVRDLRNLLIDAIPGFEFPRVNLLDYTIIEAENALEEESSFAADLSSEEINILAILMMIGWTQRQVTSIENTRMKYSSSDFKFTSQANHLAKLLTLLQETQRQSHHMQRLYKRRRTDESGRYESNWSVLRDSSALN